MAERIFIVTEFDGYATRVKAERYHSIRPGVEHILRFYKRAKDDDPSAEIVVKGEFSVIPEDMLYESIAETITAPSARKGESDNNDTIDFLKDAIFSNADKTPFNLDERRIITDALEASKREIQRVFNTNSTQQEKIERRIDDLAEKVNELNKFDWKRFFVSTLVGISADLSFGTLIPTSLMSAFNEMFTHFFKRLRRPERNQDDTDT